MNMPKRPVLTSFLLTLLMLLFPVLAGTIISMMKLGELSATLVQTIAFFGAALTAFVLTKKIFGDLGAVGLKIRPIENLRNYLWFIPLFLVEIIPFFFGLKENLELATILIYLLFTLTVGFTEEFYFRGLIAGILRPKSLKLAIVLSSVLFSVGHLANLLSGADALNTLLQILFALTFGVIAMLISFSTGSLLIAIMWHFAHNFIALFTASNQGTKSLMAGSLQLVLMILYAIFLWPRLKEGLLREHHEAPSS